MQDHKSMIMFASKVTQEVKQEAIPSSVPIRFFQLTKPHLCYHDSPCTQSLNKGLFYKDLRSEKNKEFQSLNLLKSLPLTVVQWPSQRSSGCWFSVVSFDQPIHRKPKVARYGLNFTLYCLNTKLCGYMILLILILKLHSNIPTVIFTVFGGTSQCFWGLNQKLNFKILPWEHRQWESYIKALTPPSLAQGMKIKVQKVLPVPNYSIKGHIM